MGLPQRNLQRACFFVLVKYNIGEELFSFHDLENGILRGNASPPYGKKATFGSDDKSKRLILKVDNRNHFGLNCKGLELHKLLCFFVFCIFILQDS